MKQQTYHMKTSELIKVLTAKLEKNGDLPVRFSEEENDFDGMGNSVPAGGVVTIHDTDEADTPKYEIIMSSYNMHELGMAE